MSIQYHLFSAPKAQELAALDGANMQTTMDYMMHFAAMRMWGSGQREYESMSW